jgi:Uma2 family endonuclease
MSTVEQAPPPLAAGDFLSLDEFLSRWEALPRIKRAELIRGVVYMPSPVSPVHGSMENNVSAWLGVYKAYTPGCEAGNNTTWLMEEEAPQPDTSLWVLPEYGGEAGEQRGLLSGAPGFLAEVCLSSASYDLHQKLEVYQEAGVQEYLAVLMHERELRWHRLSRRRFKVVPAPADGIYRSNVFPGLWLDSAALLGNEMARVLKVLQQGIDTPEHEAFVNRLAARKARGG